MLFTDSLKVDLIGLFIGCLATLLAWHKWSLGYWQRKGVPGPKPLLLFGNMKDMAMGKKTIGDIYKDLYFDLKPKGIRHAGIYFFGAANYVPLHLDLVKRVMQSDFGHFHSRGLYVNEKVEPLSAHIFSLDGSRWRDIRAKLTSSFSTGKIKMMYPNVIACSNVLVEVLEASAKNNPVEMKDIMSRFTIDVIGSSVFGLEVNSMKNPKAEFKKFSDKILSPSAMDLLKILPALAISHDFLRSINYVIQRKEISDFFYGIIESAVNYREKNRINRKDFLNLLIDLKGKGILTLREVAAQTMIFVFAGYETSSSAINFVAYELAIHSEIQEKLRDEINRVLKKHNDEVTYEAIMEMEYLDKVVHEALRKYPTLQFFFRRCTKDITIEEENVLIEKGTLVMIPVIGIHYDPEYYPDPEKFDPERFNEENKKKRSPFTFLSFGEGPRICIAARFGLLQTKVGVVTLIRNFKLGLNPKTISPIVFKKRGLVTVSEGGIWLDLQKISTN